MKQFIKDKWIIVFYFIFVGLATLIALIHDNKGYDDSFVEYEKTDFSRNWKYDFGDGCEGITDLPSTLEWNGSDTLILQNYLPKIQEDEFLIFKAKHTAVRIYIGEELRLDTLSNRTDRDFWYNMNGLAFEEVRVYPEDSFKKVVIESKSPMSRYIKSPGEVYLGERGSFLLSLIRQRKSTLVCSILLLFLGLILLALWFVYTVLLKKKIREVFCLALFSLSVSVWLLTEGECAQFLMKDTGILTGIAYQDLMLMPIPILLYFSYYCEREKARKATSYAAILPIGVFVINNILHVLKLIPLSDTLTLTQAMLGFEIILVAVIQITEIYYKKKKQGKTESFFWTIPLFGILIIVPLALGEVIEYAFFANRYHNNGVLISIGVCIYLCSLACDSVVRISYTAEKYKESSEIKSQFLANMSHEIRTPLNAILGFNEVIIRKSTDEVSRNYALEIQSAGNNLKQIINSILDISKIESGKLEIYSVEYNVANMLDGIVSMFETLASKKGLTLISEIDERIPISLIGDENHLTQAITNIMSNAVKYTEKGSVLFKVELLEIPEGIPVCKLRFTIRDTGIGIKEEDLSKLFDKFSRFDREKNYSVEGTGLGMNIVGQLLKAMGSEIQVESVYGEGSTFYFELLQSVVVTTQIGSFEERRKAKAEESLSKFDFVAPEAEILIVDDVQMNLDTASALLEQFEIQIDTAHSGMEAIEKVKNRHYDLVLMDHMMPGMDGIETTEAIRNLAIEQEDVYYASLPIIALTANAVVGMKEHFFQVGMQDFVSKPIELDALNMAIKKWLPKDKVKPLDKSQPINVSEETDDWGQVPKGFDKEIAMKYCPAYSLFERNIRTYAGNYEATREKLLEYKASEDVNNYMIVVHGLKSTSKMIGKEDISEVALSQEMYCRNNMPEQVFPETEKLLDMYKACCDDINEFLRIIDGNEPREESIDSGAYEDLMRRIHDAADSFDMGAFMELEDELDKLVPATDKKEEFDKVKELVANTAFGEVAELLAVYK